MFTNLVGVRNRFRDAFFNIVQKTFESKALTPFPSFEHFGWNYLPSIIKCTLMHSKKSGISMYDTYDTNATREGLRCTQG